MLLTSLLAFRLFLDPLPIWTRQWLWAALMLPLCAGVAVVYKAIRCRSMSEVVWQSFELFQTIVLGMVAAAAVLAAVARYMNG